MAVFICSKIEKGFEQGGSKRSLRKKTVRWTVFNHVGKERSDAKIDNSPSKNPYFAFICQNIHYLRSLVDRIFLFSIDVVMKKI